MCMAGKIGVLGELREIRAGLGPSTEIPCYSLPQGIFAVRRGVRKTGGTTGGRQGSEQGDNRAHNRGQNRAVTGLEIGKKPRNYWISPRREIFSYFSQWSGAGRWSGLTVPPPGSGDASEARQTVTLEGRRRRRPL
jgi:hypothetical protein